MFTGVDDDIAVHESGDTEGTVRYGLFDLQDRIAHCCVTLECLPVLDNT